MSENEHEIRLKKFLRNAHGDGVHRDYVRVSAKPDNESVRENAGMGKK
ncbi:hypothetical protein DSM106972_066190 [Dulcicalothrix desertica PCC 7102]|uniref:Uncharacterized protein n=1 Tax=Dulcicalothrix desertica PCC 7102 TaxID=232991 RepID=A0A433V5Z3_9CYAN|nr:hypothetical protein DSM106972_066190 [Dulcicalothrix desertica PCC 7102]